MSADINRFKGQFIQHKPEDKKPKPKRDTGGVVQGHFQRSAKHAPAYASD